MRKIITITLVIILFISNSSFAFQNPSKDEIEKIIEIKATEMGIPSVLLKAIARVESNYTQFRKDGSVYTGDHGHSLGMMQINTRSTSSYDRERLKFDIEYNVEAGARILLGKWNSSVKNLPWIGNMDPNILEHWYFALWAYNGWSDSNNPNTNKKAYTYQEMINQVCREGYNIEWTLLNPDLLPKTGKPEKENYSFQTPEPFHFGDIAFYNLGDTVVINSMAALNLRDAPGGNIIGKVDTGGMYEVTSMPTLIDGYYWYRITNNNIGIDGYVAGNYIKRIDDSKIKYNFIDILEYSQRDIIQNLFNAGILTDNEEHLFNPEREVTREELCVLLQRILKLDDYANIDDLFLDSDKIDDWSKNAIAAVVAKGYIHGQDGEFRARNFITKEELSIVLNRVFNDYEGEQSEAIMEFKFCDDDLISEWAYEAVYNVHGKGLLDAPDAFFNPKENVKRIDLVTSLEYLYYIFNE